MSETPTTDINDDNFDLILQMQAADRARRLTIEAFEPEPNLHEPKLKITKRGRFVVGLLTAGGLVLGGAAAVDELSKPSFTASEETVATIGDSLWEIAERISPDEVNRAEVVSYIGQLPENAETLSDGHQNGEPIFVPKEITPR